MSETSVKKGNVSFPVDDTNLVTAIYGPEDPWFKDEEVTAELLIGKYRESCVKHGVEPLQKLIDQLGEFSYTQERIPRLDLSGTMLEFLVCETLEEVLKRVRFETINLDNTHISEEGAVALFEMIEYYEACQTLNISRNENILARGWQACARMIKKTQSLRELIAKETVMKEEFIPFLARTLKIGTHLSILNLERCRLNGRPITMLANALRMNRSLQQIYLGENQLESMDAYNLSNLLTHNSNLQLLDLSNNTIGDKGAQHLCLCLAEKVHMQRAQSPSEGKTGLLVLVLWNNCLTQLSGQHFAKLVEKYTELEILNVGHNNLTDAWLRGLREPLKSNQSLYLLGLQSTKLGALSATEMATILETNTTLQRVDLRDNQLGVEGLRELRRALDLNGHISQLDLDQNPAYLEGDEASTSQYEELYHQVVTKLSQNADKTPPEASSSKLVQGAGLNSRKISLTCEIKIPQAQPKKTLSSGRLRSPAPSPTPSPILSPLPSPGKSRFSVSKVQDAPKPVEVRSRFSITPVKDIPKIILPEEKITLGFQIQNNTSDDIFKFDLKSDQNSNLDNNKNDDDNKSEIIIKNDENFNFDSQECDTEVECITANMKHNDLETIEENFPSPQIINNSKTTDDISAKSSFILEVTSKDNKSLESLETITEMNPAYIDTQPPKVLTRPGILSKKSKISNTYPPRLDDIEPYYKNSTKNSDVSKTEHKSTLQNLFALFQTPSISFSSTASAFYAKTEAKMSQIVPSLSSITLNYEPFKFNSKHTTSSKPHLEKHIDSLDLNKHSKVIPPETPLDSTKTAEDSNVESQNVVRSEKSSDTEETSKLLSEDEMLESKLELRMGKKRKSKKKNVVDNTKKFDSFWDFGDEGNSVPGSST